jgi:hypothetical protein
MVVYYTGDGAELRRGTVDHVYLQSEYWGVKNIRVIIRTGEHLANVGHRLCMVEGV